MGRVSEGATVPHDKSPSGKGPRSTHQDMGEAAAVEDVVQVRAVQGKGVQVAQGHGAAHTNEPGHCPERGGRGAQETGMAGRQGRGNQVH